VLTFQILKSLSMADMSVALLLLHDESHCAQSLAVHLNRLCDMPVRESDTAPVLEALVRRRQFRIAAGDDGQPVHLPTPGGRQRILDAFTSFVRVADLGHGALELSLVASLATRRIEEARAARPRSPRPRKPANDEDQDDDGLSPTLH
jgi:hypothetical protein